MPLVYKNYTESFIYLSSENQFLLSNYFPIIFNTIMLRKLVCFLQQHVTHVNQTINTS